MFGSALINQSQTMLTNDVEHYNAHHHMPRLRFQLNVYTTVDARAAITKTHGMHALMLTHTCV